MDCKITSIKRAASRRGSAGFLLAETVIAVLVVSILMLAIVMFMVFSTRSFATMYNYVDLDDKNRIAIDYLTRDIRQCKRVLQCSATRLVVEDDDGLPLEYYHEAGRQELVRVKWLDPTPINTLRRVVLTGCDRMNFQICQRNAMSGTYDVYPAATPANAKVVNVSWVCSRNLLRLKENTESVQTARIVIRKQGT
jgi:hypothetical protein